MLVGILRTIVNKLFYKHFNTIFIKNTKNGKKKTNFFYYFIVNFFFKYFINQYSHFVCIYALSPIQAFCFK